MAVPTLEIENLTITYETESGELDAVRDVSLNISKNETFGLVGESGSGKTTLALGAIRYLAANGRIRSGQVRLSGQSLTDMPLRDMCGVWGSRIGMVYQNPGGALNPSLKIGWQLAEAAQTHQQVPLKEAMRLGVEMLGKVAMPNPETIAGLYPHQLSGGMLQRCIIAMALINNPKLLIMDEPTTALDVTTQAVVLDLVTELKREFESAILYITHDLAVVAQIADRIGVMYAGELMEVCDTGDMFKKPFHPYSLNLIGCIPHFDRADRKQSLVSIPGRIPRLNELPPGCIFAPRCKFVEDECRAARPPLTETAPGHWTACRRWDIVPDAIARIKEERKKYGRPENPPELLKVENLSKYFPAQENFFSLSRGPKKLVKAVNSVSLTIKKGFTMGVVGESGCGKTTLMRTIIGLLSPTDGKIILDGLELKPSIAKRRHDVLGKIQMVFQNPDASLNPKHTIAQAIQRPMLLLGGVSSQQVVSRTYELLEAVNLPASYYHRLPGELSGGEKQRVAIARAFAANPDLVLLDEPLSALDVSVQASLINLLFELQTQNAATYLFISHDLAAVHHISDWIAVMYLGQVVETGDADDVFDPPFHPYTEALLSAIPVADPDLEQNNIRLEGSVPSAAAVPPGCPFHTRCPRKIGRICETELPPWREGNKKHRIWCHIPLDELAEVQSGTLGNDYHCKTGGAI